MLAAVRVASAGDAADPEPRAEAPPLPGTTNDAVEDVLADTLAVRTRDGYAIDGSMPEDLVTRVDGFEVPLFHRGGRSAATWLGVAAIDRAAADRLDWSGGTAALDVTSRAASRDTLDLSTLDATAAAGVPGTGALALRRSVFGYAIPALVPADRELAFAAAPAYGDLVAHARIRAGAHWELDATLYETDDRVDRFADRARSPDQETAIDRAAGRLALHQRYRRGAWSATFAQSAMAAHRDADHGLVQHDHAATYTLDSWNELQHPAHDLAGLATVTWTVGAELHVARHVLDIADAAEPRENVPRAGPAPFDDVSHRYRGTVWTPDAGMWTAATARLSARIVATTGLRLDAFGSNLAVQPRGSLALELANGVRAALEAGAYRRAPEHGEELEHPELHPERTTRVALVVTRTGARYARFETYYLDRTHLIERDGFGALVNTGRGTTYGMFAVAGGRAGPWRARLALRLEHADRQDAPRASIRPFEYDQPVRFEARLGRRWGAFELGARFALRSGLPYTAVVASGYDADRDVYLPSFGKLYAERLPWQHQLDVRADWQVARHLALYLDIANVYDHRSAVGWAYNFDFTQRRAVEARSIWPTLGVRGEL